MFQIKLSDLYLYSYCKTTMYKYKYVLTKPDYNLLLPPNGATMDMWGKFGYS